MNSTNLRDVAMELLMIDRDFSRHLNNPRKNAVECFTLHTFEQIWGNTSGGFQGIGGSAMTTQRTYVFVPLSIVDDEECLVFFGGRFAYHAPYNDIFKEDIANQSVAGLSDCSKYR